MNALALIVMIGLPAGGLAYLKHCGEKLAAKLRRRALLKRVGLPWRGM